MARVKLVDMYVGASLRELRCLRGLSQDELAREVGITFQQVQKYETGKNRIAASRLYDLSQVLGVNVESFFEGLDGGAVKPISISREAGRLLEGFSQIEEPDKREVVQSLVMILGG